MSAMVTFHRPFLFWLGCALTTAGVLAHGPMLLMARHTGWQMAGMAMTPEMMLGMAMIPLGVGLSGWGLMPPRGTVAVAAAPALRFHVADGTPLNHQHVVLVLVLVVTLAVDVMKPATLGFVLPGVSREYGIGTSSANMLTLVALTGTTVGSVVWGRLADEFGRRASILLAALMFIGTAICGAMPTFEWNLAMCFLMGASAGGLLPIAFTLMAETVPAAHRGWLLVTLGGIGTAAGYLLAAGAAAVLEPLFSWRVLWLLGLPTGALIILLNRHIPESPRFLAGRGRHAEARAVLRRFAGNRYDAIETDDAAHPGPPLIDESHPVRGVRALTRGRYGPISLGLLLAGLSWGLVNFGVLLWLPVNLAVLGVDEAQTSALLARSAIYALPGVGIAIGLYHYWSSIGSLVLFSALTAVVLLLMGLMAWSGTPSTSAVTAVTVALLIGVTGMIAMLIPYAAEIYPVHLRGTGSGVVAASSKAGGILGAGVGVLGLFAAFTLSAVLIAIPIALSAGMLWRYGVETRGYRLEVIQRVLRRP